MIEQYECLKVFIKDYKPNSLSFITKNSEIFKQFRSTLIKRKYSFKDSFLLLQDILGEGKGSTPESDDFIMGILCCFQIFNPEYDFSFLSIIPFEKFTTTMSSKLFRSIARKRYPKELHKFLNLLKEPYLSSNQRISFTSEIRKIAQIGVSSGVNFLHGVFWELNNILNESFSTYS